MEEAPDSIGDFVDHDPPPICRPSRQRRDSGYCSHGISGTDRLAGDRLEADSSACRGSGVARPSGSVGPSLVGDLMPAVVSKTRRADRRANALTLPDALPRLARLIGEQRSPPSPSV
jgi:hypothetical protein